MFTSGGSEANNAALLGAWFARPEGTDHLVTTTVEHPAILDVLKVHLRREVVEVVPVAERVVTTEEWTAMADHSVGVIPKSRLLPQLGMLLANSTPAASARTSTRACPSP